MKIVLIVLHLRLIRREIVGMEFLYMLFSSLVRRLGQT